MFFLEPTHVWVLLNHTASICIRTYKNRSRLQKERVEFKSDVLRIAVFTIREEYVTVRKRGGGQFIGFSPEFGRHSFPDLVSTAICLRFCLFRRVLSSR